ncbi:nucleolar transcription factor 1-like isoform X3 [Thunnus albacares]|uniref:nucleolar transcription factor 1-like isoform X3 n=2 Tax=Thunnus albacares TaxID=8236 RepID=UPI001CF6DC0B|nr:nucleolar transcription factor 1-like isoform X3 [Thunnus albacares]
MGVLVLPTKITETFVFGKTSEAEMETEESGWTKANLQKLLAAMKTNLSQNDRMRTFYQGMKSLDWDKVAFPPFSPEACQEKWKDMLRKMRKIRTLTELIVEAEDVISNPTLNQKIHPELPKAPTPANAIFYEENMAKFHKKYPKMDNRELLKLMMNKYVGLPDEEKAKYEEKYQRAKKEYERRMEKFREQYQEAPHCKRKTKRKRKKVSKDTSDQGEQCSEDAEENNTKKSRDGLPPKPPHDGYSLFCKEQVGNMEGVSGQAFVTVWAKRWQKLTDKQKSEYKTRSQELQREYSVKLNQYLSTFDADEQQRILDENNIKRPKPCKITKRQVKSVKTFPGEPKMPCRSGNVIFCKKQMEQIKEKVPNGRKRFVKVQQMWKELSTREKEGYKEQVNDNLRKYSKELQKWFETLTAAEQEGYRICNPSKCKYLDATRTETNNTEVVYIPSDSEDEDIEDSSSDEEESDEEEEEEEDDDDDVLMFDIY